MAEEKCACGFAFQQLSGKDVANVNFLARLPSLNQSVQMPTVLEDDMFSKMKGPSNTALKYDLYSGSGRRLQPHNDRRKMPLFGMERTSENVAPPILRASVEPVAKKEDDNNKDHSFGGLLMATGNVLWEPKISISTFKMPVIVLIVVAIVVIVSLEYIRAKLRRESYENGRLFRRISSLSPPGGHLASLDTNLFIAPRKSQLGLPPGFTHEQLKSMDQVSKWMVWNAKPSLLGGKGTLSNISTQYDSWSSVILPVHAYRQKGAYSQIYKHIISNEVTRDFPMMRSLMASCMIGFVSGGPDGEPSDQMTYHDPSRGGDSGQHGIANFFKNLVGGRDRNASSSAAKIDNASSSTNDIGCAGDVNNPSFSNVPHMNHVDEWSNRFTLRSVESSNVQLSSMLELSKTSPGDLRKMLLGCSTLIRVGLSSPQLPPTPTRICSAQEWLSQISLHASGFKVSCSDSLVMQDWSDSMGTGSDRTRRYVTVYRAMKSRGICTARMASDFAESTGDKSSMNTSKRVFNMTDMQYEDLISNARISFGGVERPTLSSEAQWQVENDFLLINPEMAENLTPDLLLVNSLQQSVRELTIDSVKRPYDASTWWY